MSKWSGIPQFPRAHYEVDVGWDHIEWHLDRWDASYGLALDPDYQRAHVWSEAQQVAYVEYVLAGGEVGKHITWNCVGWDHNARGKMELVDGKQRLEAVRKFMRGDLEVFGMRYAQGEGLRLNAGFKWRVCSLSRADVLRLYLNINAGGTPHTSDELDRVRSLLDEASGLSEDERRYVEAVRRGAAVLRGMSPPFDKACTHFVAGFLGVDPRMAGRRLAALERNGVLTKTVCRVDGKPSHSWEVVS